MRVKGESQHKEWQITIICPVVARCQPNQSLFHKYKKARNMTELHLNL